MPLPKKKITVLFLCTGNSCRSQIAEGWTRHLKGSIIEAYSAGIAPTGIDPLAIRVMDEVEVDISGQQSNPLEEFLGIEFDYVVTLCGHANENCPAFPGKSTVVHFGLDDPPALTRGFADEVQVLDVYRRVRDEAKAFIEQWPDRLTQFS